MATRDYHADRQECLCNNEFGSDLGCPVHGPPRPKIMACMGQDGIAYQIGWLCPKCNKGNAPNAMKCGHCADALPTQGLKAPNDGARCPECGRFQIHTKGCTGLENALKARTD